jgi:signal transduction histidine kinase
VWKGGDLLYSPEIGALSQFADWAIAIDGNGRIVDATESAQAYGVPHTSDGEAWSEALSPGLRPLVRTLLAESDRTAGAVTAPVCGEVELPGGSRGLLRAIVCRDSSASGRRTLLFFDLTAGTLLEQALTDCAGPAAVGLISRGVAHSFNNVLAGIVLNAELLADAAANRRRGLLERIMTSAEHGATLCRALLDVAGRTDSQPTTVHLAPMLSDLLALLDAEARRHGVTVGWTPGADLYVQGQHALIQQALLNLLLHAHEITGARGRIWVSTASQGETAFIQISCDAPGPETAPGGEACAGLRFTVAQRLAGRLGTAVQTTWPRADTCVLTLPLPTAHP